MASVRARMPCPGFQDSSRGGQTATTMLRVVTPPQAATPTYLGRATSSVPPASAPRLGRADDGIVTTGTRSAKSKVTSRTQYVADIAEIIFLAIPP